MSVQPLARIARFAAALHGAGAPAHIIEALVSELFAAERLEGTVVASPTAIWLAVDDRARVLRLEPGDLHLDRLAALYAWHARATRDPTAADLEPALDGLTAPPTSPWSARAQHLAFAGVAGIAGWLIGGSPIDLVAGTVGGLYLQPALAALSAPSWRPIAMVVVGLLGGLFGGFAGLAGAHPAAVALATVIVVVPGLGMTVALAEVAAGHWSAGGARLLGALASAGQLAAGLAMGAAATAVLPQAEFGWALAGASIAAPLFGAPLFAVLLHARPSQIPATMGVSALGFAIAAAIPGPMGAGLAALAVGLAANLLTRTVGVPSLATSVPGILLLVPGSVGVRGFGQLVAGDLAGTQTAVDALFAAGALALGLLAAHALLPARPSPDPHLEAPCASRSPHLL
jgi:uncharacterized membrane protein YjjB (DUF3815 family)